MLVVWIREIAPILLILLSIFSVRGWMHDTYHGNRDLRCRPNYRKKYVFSVIHSREAPQNAGSSPYLWSSTCSLMKFWSVFLKLSPANCCRISPEQGTAVRTLRLRWRFGSWVQDLSSSRETNRWCLTVGRAKGHVGSLWSEMDRTTFWVPKFEVCFDFCSFNVSSDSSTLLVKSQENQCNTCILSSKAVSLHMLGSVRQVQSKTSEFWSQNSGFIMVYNTHYNHYKDFLAGMTHLSIRGSWSTFWHGHEMLTSKVMRAMASLMPPASHTHAHLDPVQVARHASPKCPCALLAMSFFMSWKCRNVLEFPEWTDPNLSNLFQSWFEVPIKSFTPLFMFQTVHDTFQDWLQSMCGLQRWIHLDLGVRLSVGFRELGFQHQGGSPLVPVGNRMLLATRWLDVRLHDVACKIKQE